MGRGTSVQYYSASRNQWIDCQVTEVDPASGAIQVSVRPGCWLTGSDLSTKIRTPDHLATGNIHKGDVMQYYSSSWTKWIDCQVTEVDPASGGIQVSVRPGFWLGPDTDLGAKIRY